MHTHTTPNGHDFPSGEISAGFLQEKRRSTPNSSDVISHWFPFAAPPVVSPARFTTYPGKRWYCFQHWQYTDFHWFQKRPQMPRSNVNPDTAMGEYRVLVQSHPLVTAWCTAPRCGLFFSPPSSYCSVHRRNPFLMFSGQDNSFSNSWIDKPLID